MNIGLDLFNKLIYEVKKPNKGIAKTHDYILKEIQSTIESIDVTRHKMTEITDPDLIDSHIYMILSMESKYKYLIKQAKEMDLSRDWTNSIIIS